METPRELQTREVAHWESQAIDIRNCAQLEIVVTLYEHERAGLRFETWPDAVRGQIGRVIERWLAEHPERELRRIATGVEHRCCIAIFHHRQRASATPLIAEGPSPAGAPHEPDPLPPAAA